MDVIIRNEIESDIDVITKIVKKAFENHPYSHNTEQFIIHKLRSANALTISLVAEADGKVVGHIAFSPVTISNGRRNWYGLGPVAASPEFQNQGIGQSLINNGLTMLKALDAHGCVLVGDPNYYHRFGFKNLPALHLDGVPQENFLALPFEDNLSRGSVTFHEVFNATAPCKNPRCDNLW